MKIDVSLIDGLKGLWSSFVGKETEDETSSLNLEDAIKATSGMKPEEVEQLLNNPQIEALTRMIEEHGTENRKKSEEKEDSKKIGINLSRKVKGKEKNERDEIDEKDEREGR